MAEYMGAHKVGWMNPEPAIADADHSAEAIKSIRKLRTMLCGCEYGGDYICETHCKEWKCAYYREYMKRLDEYGLSDEEVANGANRRKTQVTISRRFVKPHPPLKDDREERIGGYTREERRAYMAAYRAKNRDRLKLYAKEYRELRRMHDNGSNRKNCST